MGRMRNEEIVAPGGLKVFSDEGTTTIVKVAAVTSAVNQITLTPAITAVSPTVTATGTDTNIGLRLAGKGTGIVSFDSKITEKTTATTLTSANNTATAAQTLGGIFIKTTANGTLTLPTAALLVAAMPGAAVGDTVSFLVRNRSGGAETVAVGSGGTSVTGNTLTVADANTRLFLIRLTNVTASSEAYDLYSIGVSAH